MHANKHSIGGRGGSLAKAQLRWQRQRVGKHSGSAEVAAATRRQRRQLGVGGGGGSSGSTLGSVVAAGEARDVLAIFIEKKIIPYF
jgi:hypothetical protein